MEYLVENLKIKKTKKIRGWSLTPKRAWIVQYPKIKNINVEKTKRNDLYKIILLDNNEIIGLVRRIN